MKYLSLLYIAVLAALLLLPLDRLGIKPYKFSEIRSDYVYHFLAFLPWMFISLWNVKGRTGRTLWLALGCCIVVGIEYVQEQTGYRSFEYKDMVYGGLGLLCSLLIRLALHHIRKGR